MPETTMTTPAVIPGLSRRGMLARAGLASAAAALGSGLLDVGPNRRGNSADASQNLRATYVPTGSKAKFAINDTDILTFALNTEYFEAGYYSRGVNGSGLPASLLTGGQGYGKSPYKAVDPGTSTAFVTGTSATTTAGNTPVPFTDPVVQEFFQEVAQDEAEHVTFLRTALGKLAPAQPACDYATSFTLAMRAAGVIGATDIFDPFVSQRNFLLGAFFINDIGPTAYIGAAPYVSVPAHLAAAAGLLGVEAYHAGETRALVYSMGQTDDALLVQANAIATLRNNTSALAGTGTTDQGIELVPGQSNLTPTDANAIAFPRSFSAILSLFYLNTVVTQSPAPGGFTPAGFNGRIR